MKTLPDFDILWGPVPDAHGGNCPVQIVGIRGALAPSGAANGTARYDDLIMVRIGGHGAAVKTFRAALDPSWLLIQHPINPGGAAMLQPGVWMMEKHFMHGDPAKKALCQANPVRIWRLDSTGKKIGSETGEFGICIHSGGSGVDTGRFSAGCQILANVDGYFGEPFWSGFIHPIRSAMDQYRLAQVPYMLLEDTGYSL